MDFTNEERREMAERSADDAARRAEQQRVLAEALPFGSARDWHESKRRQFLADETRSRTTAYLYALAAEAENQSPTVREGAGR